MHFISRPERFNFAEHFGVATPQVVAFAGEAEEFGHLDVEVCLELLAHLLKGFGTAEPVQQLQQLNVSKRRRVLMLCNMALQDFDGLVVFAN